MVPIYVIAYTYVERCYKTRHRWSRLILQLARQRYSMLRFCNKSTVRILGRLRNSASCVLEGPRRYLYRRKTQEQKRSPSIRLPADIAARLSNRAAVTGRTKSFYITQAICDQLDDLEDLYLAEQRMIELRAGRSKKHTLDEVERAVGLAD